LKATPDSSDPLLALRDALAPETRVSEEVADVLLYLIRLADRLDLDLIACATEKLRRNAEKYPVGKARGNARKYTEL
jgi:dCTP diphosphatase